MMNDEIMEEKKITVTDTFVIAALEERRNQILDKFCCNDGEPFWDDFVEYISSGEFILHKTPEYYVDNFLINGDYGHIDEYRDRNANETKEECIERLKPILVKDDYIFFNWGIE